MNNGHKPSPADSAPDEEIRRKLNRLLIVPGSVITLCRRTEAELEHSIPELVVRISAECAQALERDFMLIDKDKGMFRIAQTLYEFKISEDHPERAVCVSILPLERGERLVTVDLALKDGGKYSRTRLTIPGTLARMSDPLGEAIQALYASGYKWLNAHGEGRLKSLQGHSPKDREIISELYSHIRAELHEHSDYVTVFALGRKDAFFLFDSIHITTALDRNRAQSSRLAVSPLETTALLVTQRLDANLTISRAVIGDGQPISENLVESRYADTGVPLAEMAFYGMPGIVCQPLVREGKIRLTAAYPAPLSAEIEPQLNRITGQLKETVRGTRFSLRRPRGQRAGFQPGWLLRETGEVVRGIAGEAVRREAEHSMLDILHSLK
jgi:hypothetical protein